MKEVKEKVFYALAHCVECRDSDEKLIANVWEMELGSQNVSYRDALLKCSKPMSITRVRKLLQNQHEELRGNNYVKRQRHAKKVVQEIREIEEELRG